MLVKLLTLIVVLMAAGLLFSGRRAVIPARGKSRAAARLPRAHDLAKCGRCGVWLPSGQACDCSGRS